MAMPKIRAAVLTIVWFLLGGSLAGAAPPTLAKPQIVAGPASSTRETAATLDFASSEEGVSFTCRLDGSAWEPCVSPTTYASLAEGSHDFSVRAVAGDDLSLPAHWSWKVDLTPPVLPGNQTKEAASPLGTVVNFSATDNLDPSPALSCSPASGSVFEVGPPANVDCTARDAAGNESAGSFTVTIVDTTPPVLDQHQDVIAAQESSPGAVVHYDLPTTTDNSDAAPLIRCTPSSGSTFPLGTSHVTCFAVDASENESAPGRFDVIVQAGPAPAVPLLTSDVGVLTNRTSVALSFKTGDGASLACKLDGPAGEGAFAMCASPRTYADLGDGSYLFTVRATNSIGNVSEATFGWVVDTIPPGQVRRVHSSFGDGWVRLSWRNPTDVDYARVSVWRRKVGRSFWKLIATRKDRTSFRDGSVRNDTRYVYALRSIDRARNDSPPKTIEGRASKILNPGFDAVRGSPPLIDWTSVENATYFNMQLWRGGRKILSVWPRRSAYRLPATWTYNGGRYSLRSDRYLVYVWPGFGAKSAVDYGRLLGWTAFRMR